MRSITRPVVRVNIGRSLSRRCYIELARRVDATRTGRHVRPRDSDSDADFIDWQLMRCCHSGTRHVHVTSDDAGAAAAAR